MLERIQRIAEHLKKTTGSLPSTEASQSAVRMVELAWKPETKTRADGALLPRANAASMAAKGGSSPATKREAEPAVLA